MTYLSTDQVTEFGFKHVGNNVLISDKASVYNANKISIGDNCRIDDFCLLSGSLDIGSFTHLAPYCMLAGGESGIVVGHYVTFAYGAKVFSETDDYSGKGLVGSLVPRELKIKLEKEQVYISSYCIIGTNSTIMPPSSLAEGVAVGAHSLVKTRLDAWGLYCGVPAVFLRSRSRAVKTSFLEIESTLLS